MDERTIEALASGEPDPHLLMQDAWRDFEHAPGVAYPRAVRQRYELRHGKFGPYFHDTRNGYDMPLDEVLNTLNRYALRKAQLTWFVGEYGEPENV